jgi:hypothetical protein
MKCAEVEEVQMVNAIYVMLNSFLTVMHSRAEDPRKTENGWICVWEAKDLILHLYLAVVLRGFQDHSRSYWAWRLHESEHWLDII